MTMVKTSQQTTAEAVIHPTAVIDPSAKIAEGVVIGPWVYIGPEVSIGEGTVIDSHVVIKSHTKIGKHNKIHSFVAVGGDPQDLNYHGEDTWLEIGDHNIIRENVTINRGSVGGGGRTQIKNHSMLLAYSHVAHDCIIEDHVQLVNHATLAGHVHIFEHAIVGAFTAIHQFVNIGAYSFISRLGQVTQDILPFTLATGMPAYPRGLNLVGLRRNGFSNGAIKVLKQAFHTIYDSRTINMQKAREQLLELVAVEPSVQRIIDAMDQTKRGIARHTGNYEPLDVASS